METDRQARISTVTGTYFRSGKCSDCGTSVERTKSFTAATQDEVSQQAAAWAQSTLRHKRCETAR